MRRSGSGVPVILVHGSAGGEDSWDPVLPFLEPHYETWVYARRAYRGDTFAADAGRRAAALTQDDVADLAAVIEAAVTEAAVTEVAVTGHGVRGAHVVGGSYGATVALHAAGLPGVRSLTLFEPPLFSAGPDLAPVLAEYRQLVAARDLTRAARLFAERVARVPAAMLAYFGEVEPTPDAVAEANGCLRDLEAMTAGTLDLQRWSQVAVPALLMQGGDTWEPMPSTMDALAAVLPGVTRTTLAGQSHFATHTAPALFAERLLTFLDAH